MINIIYWFFIEKSGGLFINKKNIDYLNPLIHGSILSIYSIKELLYNNNLDKDFNQEQLKILDLSTGYFIYDLFKMALIKKYRNNLYIAHHLALLYFFHFFKKYKLPDFFIQALFFGELTNPILQIWHMSKQNNNKLLFKYTNHIFTYMFLFFRCILIPCFFSKKIPTLFNNNRISKFDLNTILTIFAFFNFGNFIWSYQLLKGYLKWLKK